MANVLDWLKRRRSLAAALAGLYVVWRVVKGVAGFGWVFGGLGFFESAFDFLRDNWLVGAGVLILLFAGTFFCVRYLIDWLDAREKRKRQKKPVAEATGD